MTAGHWERGKPRKVYVPGNREGNDLNDVLRDILSQLLDDHGWIEQDLADRIGVSQSTINRFLNQGTEGKLATVSRLCAFLDNSPLQLFGRHPLYETEARAHVRFPKDHLYDRYNMLLRNAEARDLLGKLDSARELGVLDEALQAVHNTVESARKGRATGRATPRRRRKRPPAASG